VLGLELHHDGGRRRYQLRPGVSRLGRAPDCEVIVEGHDVSRYHAELTVDEDGLRVLDLGSTNGTFVNGIRVTEAKLSPGDSLVVGSSLLVVVELDPEDCEVALSVEIPQRIESLPRGGRAEERETRDGEDRVPGAWLGVLREWVSTGACAEGEPLVRALERVREALGAAGIMVLSWDREGSVGIRGLAGEVVTPGRVAARVREVFETVGPGELSGWRMVRPGHGSGLVVGWATQDGPPRTVVALAPRCGAREAGTLLAEMALALPEGGCDCGDRIGAGGAPASRLSFPKGYVVCHSAAMRELYLELERFVSGELPILLTGETGVGKEAIARTIHLSSPRRHGPFVAVNCAAIPAELLESELFGIEDRVATGVAARPGKMVIASGGVLFLDEIGEMPVGLQAKLLRALEERQVYPVGGRRPVPVDVRLVSATNADLDSCLESGRLRRDLYYRLAGCVLRIPPLRERPGDIPLLVQRFVEEAAAETGRRVRGVSVRALEALVARSWPGNVRQLRHEVYRLVHLCPQDGLITSDLLPDPVPCTRSGTSPSPFALEPRIRALERDLILAALRETGGNRTRAAKLLGLSRYGLLLKMRRLGLEDELP